MNQRTQVVYSLLAEYVRSPSLRHMREERSLAKLALEIVTKLDRDSSVWKKWEGPRDKVLGAAIECWIPKAEMLDFLNSLPNHKTVVLDCIPTAENLAREAFRILDPVYRDTYGNHLQLDRVRLYETPNCWVDATRPGQGD